jgi:hypothetical protein
MSPITLEQYRTVALYNGKIVPNFLTKPAMGPKKDIGLEAAVKRGKPLIAKMKKRWLGRHQVLQSP